VLEVESISFVFVVLQFCSKELPQTPYFHQYLHLSQGLSLHWKVQIYILISSCFSLFIGSNIVFTFIWQTGTSQQGNPKIGVSKQAKDNSQIKQSQPAGANEMLL